MALQRLSIELLKGMYNVKLGKEIAISMYQNELHLNVQLCICNYLACFVAFKTDSYRLEANSVLHYIFNRSI
jgi:hypothetical protein